MTLTTAVVAIGATGYVIARQMMGEPVQVRRLLLLPAVLVLWGASGLDRGGLAWVGAADVVLLLAGAILAVGLGFARGATVELFAHDGVLWSRSTVATLVAWAVSIVARGLLLVVAHLLGARTVTSSAALLLMLGVTLGAQSLAVYVRGARSGVAFAVDRRSRGLGRAGSAGPR